VVVLTVFGTVVVVVGAALAYNIAGSGDFVIRNLTSRSLGTLAPGFAASPTGFKIYAFLITSIGVVLAGVGLTDLSALRGLYVVGFGLTMFIVCSVIVIVGEVRTYRALKR
jgi:hypothetical protein